MDSELVHTMLGASRQPVALLPAKLNYLTYSDLSLDLTKLIYFKVLAEYNEPTGLTSELPGRVPPLTAVTAPA